jgi:metal-dependent hydrolase (beta-lactamase superfamily II)
VLDDVIIGQASAVVELSAADPTLKWRALYGRAMNIGRDHIAATVNTLVLAYVGTALPLLLLFRVYPEPWVQTLNRELVAQEIVRSLVGSLSLMTAVPIVTLVASVLSQLKHERALPRKEALGAPGAIRVQVVCDRNAFDQRLKLSSGFACLVDAGGRRVLYLDGVDGLTLVHNLVMLGLEARNLDALVLARCEPGTAGELDSLVSLNPALAVYAPQPAGEDGRVQIAEVSDALEIAPGVFAARDPGHGGATLSLVVESGQQATIVTADPAGGIVAVVEHLQRQGARVDLLLGGFGLQGRSDEEIDAAVDGLRRAGVARVAPCHDTGQPAQWKLRAAFQDACQLAGAGSAHLSTAQTTPTSSAACG